MARTRMDLRSVLLEIHGALSEARIAHALIGGLALAAHGAGRATAGLDLLAEGERAEDVDRILRERGYECLLRNEVQSLSSDPSRRHQDLADIERLLETAEVDLERVRDYFRLFDHEKELDALLARERRR